VAPTLVLLAPLVARAENHVTVRGVYFREPSTRVVQPVVEVGVDAPSGVDVTAHYLLDAITSASAASGPSGDNIFTEYRNEAGLIMGKTWSRLRLGLAYKYSAESDYWSHIAVGSASYRAWGDSATFALSVGAGRDQVGRRVQGMAPTSTPNPGDPCMPRGATTCPLDTVFGGVGYTQVLSPTAVAQVSYEFALQSGFLSSPYRNEMLPDKRWRNAASARIGKYFPAMGGGVQIHYRFYFDLLYPGADIPGGDPWGLRTHTVEGRLYQRAGRDLEIRLSARYYSQGPVNFWCDLGPMSCPQGQIFTAAGPQHGSVKTTLLEAKIYWDAFELRAVPVLGWFAAGTFELSYGRYLQSTSFGNAHLLQTGYTLPF
jgi:hypothetical protein